MAQHEMTHPTYGTRVVEDRQVESYLQHRLDDRPARSPPTSSTAPIKAVLDARRRRPGQGARGARRRAVPHVPPPTLVTALVRIIEPADTTSEV